METLRDPQGELRGVQIAHDEADGVVAGVIGGLGPPGQAEPEGSGTAERVDDALGLFDKAVPLPGLPVDAPARRFRDLRRRGQRLGLRLRGGGQGGRAGKSGGDFLALLGMAEIDQLKVDSFLPPRRQSLDK